MMADAGAAVTNAESSGYVEFFGYHATANGWFFSGWVTSAPDLADRLQDVSAWFADEILHGPVSWLLFAREDVGVSGTGFLIFLKTDHTPIHSLSCIQIGLGRMEQNIHPVRDAISLPENKLTPQIGYVIAKAAQTPQRFEMERLLSGEAEAAAGLIEYFGYHQAAGGWFINGWVARSWADSHSFDRMAISFENADVRGEVVQAAYPRDDLPDGAHGVILFLRAPAGPLGKLQSAILYASGVHVKLTPVRSVPQYREAQLTAELKSTLAAAKPGLAGERLLNLLSRRPYHGETTLETLAPIINLHVDEAIHCGTGGLVLIGWMLAKPNEIKEIRLHCGSLTQAVSPASFLKVERPDVLAVMSKHGFEESACGFAAYVAGAMEPDAPMYLEIETRRYQTAFYNIPKPTRNGVAAIKHLLSVVDARFADIAPAFNRVIGPAVAALNQGRLALPTGYQVMEYGAPPPAPEFSVIIPLHGRLDFVEYQQALFSAQPPSGSVEFIYVLDDPPKRRDAQALFASVYERFRLPFRAILLDQNIGFAPANNAGLRHAKGEFIAYLNSDVFPGTLDWLERLSAHLGENPNLGAIGPQLIFEDGTIQHQGMYFEKLPEYGDWYFCQHHNKGLRYSGGEKLEYFPAITGACMVLRRATALQLGGFDETYIIGDFEDSDMCLKLHALGLRCAVDPTVQLYHLERKSQLSGALTWRANLTAYNAWQHNHRWVKTIETLQAGNAGRLS
jgi:GT2 family glycosyltransferase